MNASAPARIHSVPGDTAPAEPREAPGFSVAIHASVCVTFAAGAGTNTGEHGQGPLSQKHNTRHTPCPASCPGTLLTRLLSGAPRPGSEPRPHKRPSGA